MIVNARSLRAAACLVLAVAGCSSNSGSGATTQKEPCAPSSIDPCSCKPGLAGTRKCLADGSNYGACICPVAADGASIPPATTDAGTTDGGQGPAGCNSAKVFGGHVYSFCGATAPWSLAREICAGWGADLALVEDAAEDAFLYGLADWTKFDYAWLVYENTDGLFESPGAYQHWCNTEPDNVFNGVPQAHCAVVLKIGGGCWADNACDAPAPFFCEKAL